MPSCCIRECFPADDELFKLVEQAAAAMHTAGDPHALRGVREGQGADEVIASHLLRSSWPWLARSFPAPARGGPFPHRPARRLPRTPADEAVCDAVSGLPWLLNDSGPRGAAIDAWRARDPWNVIRI